MDLPFKELRKKTRLAMHKEWSKLIATTIIIMGCAVFFLLTAYMTFYIVKIIFEDNFKASNMHFSVLFIVPIILFVAYSIIIPMLLGVKKFASNITHNNYVTLKDLFYYYDANFKFKKLLGLYFSLLFRKLAMFGVFLLPSCVLTFILIFLPEKIGFANREGNYALLLVVGIFLIFVGYIIFSIFNAKYYAVTTLFLANPHHKNNSIIELSKTLSKKYQAEIVRITFRKIPFYLSCILIVPVFLVYPNIIVSDAIFSNFLIENYRKSVIK